MPRFHVIAFVMVCVAASPTSGQSPPQEPSPASIPGSTSTTSSRTDPRNHQTAEDLLRALQADRPASEIIVPVSRSVRRLGGEAQLLLPEGTTIVERPGRLVRQGEGWDFRPDDGRSMSVLPNAALEDMLAMHKDAGGDMSFVVSGEITVFDDQNFLLIKNVTRDSPAAPSQAPMGGDLPPTLPADAAAEDVLSALQSQRPISTGVPESGRSSAGRSGSGGGAALDGSLVVRRSGRLIRDGARWSFEFDDRSATGLSRVALLPNQSLEIMIQSAERGTTGLVLIVSGELTQFGAQNFLLVRGVTRMLDLGNLRP